MTKAEQVFEKLGGKANIFGKVKNWANTMTGAKTTALKAESAGLKAKMIKAKKITAPAKGTITRKKNIGNRMGAIGKEVKVEQAATSKARTQAAKLTGSAVVGGVANEMLDDD